MTLSKKGVFVTISINNTQHLRHCVFVKISITTLSIKGVFVTLSINDTQHIRHSTLQKSNNAECNYAEGHILSIVIGNGDKF